MGKRLIAFTLIIGGMLALFAGCNNDPEQNRSVVSIASLNANSPLLSDVLEQGDSIADDAGFLVIWDDHIREDWIPVSFYNKPYNSLVSTDAGYPHGDFLITRYTVTWTRTDGGTAALPPLRAGLTLLIPSGEVVDALIALVTFENKSEPVLDICYYPPIALCANAGDEVFMNAHITFYGHEVGTDRETAIEGDIGVHFADLIVESEPYRR